MERQNIGDLIAEEVKGGSIVFTPDHTRCGLNCTTQFEVNNFSAVINYIEEHYQTMSERDMLKNMMMAGLLTRI